MKTHNILFKINSIAFLTAFSIAVIFIKFPLPAIFPPFLEINYTFVPILIGYYLLGLKESFTINILRTLVKAFLIGTSTTYIGEICDFLISSITVVTIHLINYKIKNNFQHLLFGMLAWSISGLIFNACMILPYYMNVLKLTTKDFILMMPSYLNVTESNFLFIYLVAVVLPFNILISVLNISLTLGVKKIVKTFDKRFSETKEKEIEENEKE